MMSTVRCLVVRMLSVCVLAGVYESAADVEQPVSAAVVSWAASSPVGSGQCPRTCFCNTLSRIVYCSRRGLPGIPAGVAPTTVQLNLNGNAFLTADIDRRNFTELTELEHLYMSECAIERIAVDTFRDLTALRWLDLSNNRIKIIDEDTFRGVSLQHLFLNGNRNIQLLSGSFQDLSTTGLYLHDCSLVRLAPEVLSPLNSSLRYLWLNGNDLDRLERRLVPLFAGLQHLRLGANPLHCDCDAVWLKELYDSSPDVFRGAPGPSCRSPTRLRGRYFNESSVGEFLCRPPQFTRVEALFNETFGRMVCAAAGDPAPTIYWIQPNGRASRYARSGSDLVPDGRAEENGDGGQETEGALTVDVNENGPKLRGMYICIANNNAGNVTLTISVPTSISGDPLRRLPPPPTVLPPTATVSSLPPTGSSSAAAAAHRTVANPRRRVQSTPSSPTSVQPPSANPASGIIRSPDRSGGVSVRPVVADRGRTFTLPQLVGAVVGTHVLTLLMYALLGWLCYWYRCRRRRARRRLQQPAPRSVGSSTLCSGSAKLSPLPQSPCVSPLPESVYLNGLTGHHRGGFIDYVDAYRLRDGEYG